MQQNPLTRRHVRSRIVETRALSYWRAVCAELRLVGARPCALQECDVLRAAGYAPREAANVLS